MLRMPIEKNEEEIYGCMHRSWFTGSRGKERARGPEDTEGTRRGERERRGKRDREREKATESQWQLMVQPVKKRGKATKIQRKAYRLAASQADASFR